MAVLCLETTSLVAQDLEGRFYPEKDNYAVGEPVLFNVEIVNKGKQAASLPAKAGENCRDSYLFRVSKRGQSCSATWDAGCQDEESPLVPGDRIHGQWPLDTWYRFEGEGKYEVTATRHIPVRDSRGQIEDFTFSSKFYFNLKPVDPSRLQSILQDFERDLHNSDPEIRHRALDVLADLAPSYLEPTALRLVRDDDSFVAVHAIAALGRMNTPEARAALAEVIAPGASSAESAPNKPVTDLGVARIRAIEALGRGGDAAYQGLIERYADDRNEYVQLAAMVAIAELGKGGAVAEFQHFLLSPDPTTRKNAAYGLRYSTAPEAVETLIAAIGDEDPKVRARVLTSLREISGQSFGDALDTASAKQTKENWELWWKSQGDKLVIPEPTFLCEMK